MIPGFGRAGFDLAAVEVGGNSCQAFPFKPEPHHKSDCLLFLRDFHEPAVNDAVSVGGDADMGARRPRRDVAQAAVRWAQVCAAVDQGLTEGGLRNSQLPGNFA